MKRIPSFCVDHTKLQPGIYTSRIDDDIVTDDIRMKMTNCTSALTDRFHAYH